MRSYFQCRFVHRIGGFFFLVLDAMDCKVTRVRRLLRNICGNPAVHARFLNTLSLLEHAGSRKIMLSQSRRGASLDHETLKHLAEETRHAYFFRRAAEAVARRKLNYSENDLLAGAHARLYLGRLDAFITRSVQSPLAYLYMTLVVELRATWFYNLYQDVLKELEQPINLKGLLAEEKQHLEGIYMQLSALGEDIDVSLPLLKSFEESKYAALLAALERSAKI